MSAKVVHYWPRHRTQLWRPVTGRVDCGPRSWQHAIDHATRGQDVPGIDRIRLLGRVPGPQMTNVFDGSLVFDRLDLRARRVVNGDWDELTTALRRGAGVVLCISYGVLNDRNPWRSGDPNFRGGHSIYLQGIHRSRDRRLRTRSFDSLYDGRRAGIPEGPQWCRVGMLRAAAEAFAGRPGKWWGIVVPRGHVRAAVGGPGDADLADEWPVPPAAPDAAALAGVPFPEGSTGEALEYDDELEVWDVVDDDPFSSLAPPDPLTP